MRKGLSLTRQLSVAMAALSVMMIVVSSAAFYVVYAVLERWRIVAPMPANGEDTVQLDVAITLGIGIVGLVIAIALAIWLARRIARPMGAVGYAARQIAQGDLATRVEPVPEAQGETALLIADFNAMADRLERMAEDVSTWNAQIAHELRTPLTILQGRLQGAKDGVFPLDAVLLDGLLVQVAGLTRLVEDLRSVSLADSGRLDLVLTDVDLAAEIEGMAPTLRSILEPVGFTLSLVLAPGTIRADAGRIRQAVLALVDNASRHADPCEIAIRLSYFSGGASIAVEDAGPGLPAELEDRAFQQFTRGGQSAGGSGLGLSVVRGIVRAHSGNVAYRRDGTRSVFQITLSADLQ
jgi:two-component system sensor histidine kinase AdeS|tara:strand:- start:5982 stop:7037 length:1056 start_codon:yes stop_codon:yes gene_type:complete